EGQRIRTLAEDAEGALYIATLERGLYRLAGERLTKIDVGTERIRTVAASGNGVWVATEDAGLRFVSGTTVTKTVTAKDGLPSERMGAVLPLRSGGLAVGTRDAGVTLYRDGHVTRYRAEDGYPARDIASLFEDRDGNLWIGTGNEGLFRRTPDGK